MNYGQKTTKQTSIKTRTLFELCMLLGRLTKVCQIRVKSAATMVCGLSADLPSCGMGSNHISGILSSLKLGFIANRLSLSSYQRLVKTEILLKRK